MQIGFSHKLILPLVFHVEEKILKLPLLLTAVIAGTVDDGAGPGFVMNSKQIDRTGPERNNLVQFPSNTNEISKLPRQLKVNRISGLDSISEGSQLVSGKTSEELSLDVEDLDIPWSDLVLKERIGAGMFLDRVGKENMTMVN